MSYSSPQVHHWLPFQHDTDRCPDLASLLKIVLKLSGYLLESCIAKPHDLAVTNTSLDLH
jgi:hypothetical protein